MSVLYTPKGRAREYAPLAVNHYTGCAHGCTYCYVPIIPPWKFNPDGRALFHAKIQPRRNVIRQLEADCRRTKGRSQRVLLSFTSDPYQPAEEQIGLTRQVIQILHRHNYNVQVLTKGGTRALRDLDLFTPKDAFAATMTFLTDEDSRSWEPNAALPQDRLQALRAFHQAGIPTWVSLEPVLKPDAALDIIHQSFRFVDLFKIGKLNHHPTAEHIDWAGFARSAIRLCEQVGRPYYIKRDLAAFLPADALGPHHVTIKQIEDGHGHNSQLSLGL